MKLRTLLFAFLLPLTSLPADDPILEWRFDGAAAAGAWLGKYGTLADGPRPPKYPGFATDNQAMSFVGHEGAIVVSDHERGGFMDVRFGPGQTFAFETWVRFRSISKGGFAYVLGKGRHVQHGEEFPENNQNYSVRFLGTDSGAQFGILFTSEHPQTKERAWHRWWSNPSIPATGWHHVALQFTFGDADSLQAWIDGKLVDGRWEESGATDLPPVQDADDLVIGTGFTRGESSSFNGWLDNLAIYRSKLDPQQMSLRYQYVPPPPAVTREMIPAGRVLVQISEQGVPESSGWPDEPEVTESYVEDVFGFFEVPHKYVATGVRGDRRNPAHMRASALVQLPGGRHRLLLRGRGLSRLLIDGKEVLENGPRTLDSEGHTPLAVQEDYLDLGPDFRFAPPGNRDAWCEFETPGGEHFVILETMLGNIKGKQKQRPELGETVAAISLAGSESWSLLSPGQRHVPYTDAGWAAYEEERRQWLQVVNRSARAAQRAEHAEYWDSRRQAAREWLASVPAVPVPALPEGYTAANPIDHFVAARIDQVSAEAEQEQQSSVDYFEQIGPLLEQRCYDCHQGGKAAGGLRLSDRESVLRGGESDGPAITPGDQQHSAILQRITSSDPEVRMPPKGAPLTAEQIALLRQWIDAGAVWPQFDVDNFTPAPLADDLTFLRRVTLDTVGVTPSEAEIEQFQRELQALRNADAASTENDPRARVIDRLLADQRWADHWMGYWLDVLAENPNMINPTLNNTGPFRWWLYESLLDNKPLDLFVTELIRMEGSERFGGPAGFATATQNDLPMAAKGIIVSSAFLGVEMKCARCHDAPAHSSRQEDLLQLAALLRQGSVQLPETSSVPVDRLHQTGRTPLIQVSLSPGATIEPAWPFPEFCDPNVADLLGEYPESGRDRLAVLITAPQNERFAQVMVNRIWERLLGRGLVGNVSDWERAGPSHPDLLRWLAREFVASGYDLQAISRLILNSHTYQRASDPALREVSPLYVAAAPRRLTAEQIVDSAFHATGTPFDLEEVSLDIDSVRELTNALSMGKPRRSWMLASTSNERDRPSLGLPKVTAVASVLRAFGWRGARQDPRSQRDTASNSLQPAILANGVMSVWLTRLSDRHQMTQLAVQDQPVEKLVERMFLRLLTRLPTQQERNRFVQILSDGYQTRVIPEAERAPPAVVPRVRQKYVSWSNHVDGPANALALEREAAARKGDSPTSQLRDEWRLRMEDALWALLNTPEMIYSR